MKYLISTIITITILLVACASTKNKPSSNIDKLKAAILNGEDFIGNDLSFEEELDLVDLFPSTEGSKYISSQLIFNNCTFKSEINWFNKRNLRLYFDKEVQFNDCTFNEEFTIQDAIFRARLQIKSCLFRKSLKLDRNSFLFKSSIDGNEIAQDLSAQYIISQEDLNIFGNTLGNNLLLQGIQLNGIAQFSTNQLNGSIDLSKSRFAADLLMNYTKGGKKLLAGKALIANSLQLINLENFQSIDFSGARVGGDT